MPQGFYGRVGVEIVDNITDRLGKLERAIQDRAIVAVAKAGEVIRARAYELANVSPGIRGNARDGRHMRDCIEVIVDYLDLGATAKITIDINNVPYAPDQEFGPRGKPFLRPAVDESREEVRGILRDELQQAFGDTYKIRTMTRIRSVA